MKKLIENFIIIMVLTIAILFSYALIEKKISGRSSSEFINFLFSTQEKASSNKSSVTSNKGNSKKGNNSSTQSADTMNYRAVWLSYLEFNSYRKSVKNNNESSFRKFYKHILQQIKTTGLSYRSALLEMLFMHQIIFRGQPAFPEHKGKILDMIL